MATADEVLDAYRNYVRRDNDHCDSILIGFERMGRLVPAAFPLLHAILGPVTRPAVLDWVTRHRILHPEARTDALAWVAEECPPDVLIGAAVCAATAQRMDTCRWILARFDLPATHPDVWSALLMAALEYDLDHETTTMCAEFFPLAGVPATLVELMTQQAAEDREVLGGRVDAVQLLFQQRQALGEAHQITTAKRAP